MHPKSGKYYTASQCGVVKRWSGGKFDKDIHVGNHWVTDMCWIRKQSKLLVATMDRRLYLYDTPMGELAKSFQGQKYHRGAEPGHQPPDLSGSLRMLSAAPAEKTWQAPKKETKVVMCPFPRVTTFVHSSSPPNQRGRPRTKWLNNSHNNCCMGSGQVLPRETLERNFFQEGGTP